MFDFDNAPDRRGTDSMKWSMVAPQRPETSAETPSLLPLWVADMDFATAPCIIEALRRRVDHGVFGYVDVPQAYYTALDNWFRDQHGYRVPRSQVVVTTGVVPAISAIIKGLTAPGDGVMIFTPVYNCFFSSIRNNGCRSVEVPLLRRDTPDGGFTYDIDREQAEFRLRSAKMVLLCNPHNPSGRAWTREELTWLRDVCRRNGLTVLSDEIHCELTLADASFTSYATIATDADRWVVCSSPSKAFNTAGLHTANILCPDDDMRARIDRAINDNEVCDLTPFGVTGLIAAYTEGLPWLQALRAYLTENYRLLRLFFNQELTAYPVASMEATYLAWVDISAAPVADPREVVDAIEKFGVRVSPGEIYGDPRFIRINFACPRARMMDGLCRISRALRHLALAATIAGSVQE